MRNLQVFALATLCAVVNAGYNNYGGYKGSYRVVPDFCEDCVEGLSGYVGHGVPLPVSNGIDLDVSGHGSHGGVILGPSGHGAYAGVLSGAVVHGTHGGVVLGPGAHGYYTVNKGNGYYSYPKYDYKYAVSDPYTGDHKSQWESRDGDVVRGAYSLLEPDGTTRLVEYTADKNGFHPVVKRFGVAKHPQPYPKPIGFLGYNRQH